MPLVFSVPAAGGWTIEVVMANIGAVYRLTVLVAIFYMMSVVVLVM